MGSYLRPLLCFYIMGKPNVFLAIVLISQLSMVFGCCRTCCLTPKQVTDIREKYDPGFWYIRPAHRGPILTKSTTSTTTTKPKTATENTVDSYGAPASGGIGGGGWYGGGGYYGHPHLGGYKKRNVEV